MKAKRAIKAKKATMPDKNIERTDTGKGVGTLVTNISMMPSTRVLAMLAAALGAGPEEALKLWLETDRMVKGLSNLSQEKRGAVFDKFGRNFNQDGGFSDYRVTNSLREAIQAGHVQYTLVEAMSRLGVSTKGTFYNLIRYLKAEYADARTRDWLGGEQKIQEIKAGAKIDEELLGQLERAKLHKKSEAAKQNSNNARRPRKMKNIVK